MRRLKELVRLGAVAAMVFGTVAFAQELTDGLVTKIDQKAGKMTIRHGPMKKFDMEDGMTMVFRVKDPAMLKAVKPGDKVKFEADRIDGQFTVTRIERAK
jgi:Cu(I)/Ag(I) efflux system protein CusF